MNKNELSNYDIIEILNSMDIKINDICSKDKLKELQRGFYICNLQSSTFGNGTHWVAFYYNGYKNLYWDSFGFPPPQEIEDKIKPYDYNSKDIQNIGSSSCGYYCIAFIKFLYFKINKEPFYDLLTRYFTTDTKRNELILYKILYNA